MFDFSIIKSLRGKHGITADELAEKAGITRVTITKMESGTANPTIGTINAIAKAFNLKPSEFLRMIENDTIEPASPAPVKGDGFQGTRLRFKGIEVFFLTSETGNTIIFDPTWHENTAETCIVLSGNLKLSVGGKEFEIGTGEGLRYKALQDHHIKVGSRVEFILIHHQIA